MAHQLEVTVEVILHATEDSRKIFDPIFELFQIKGDEFITERTLGHYGNTILLAKITLAKKRAEEFIKKLASKIPKIQMDELIENIDMYFEDTSLFLRIGKNEIVRKEISLQQNNAIKIKVKMPVYKKDQISKKYIELLTV
ncbi:MAG: RNA-binding domain-containing protein [Candidatus Nitrosotalea sp.]|nr:RNA-binding domain-containing protein [Candidatus Nitrosotalea sp.]